MPKPSSLPSSSSRRRPHLYYDPRQYQGGSSTRRWRLSILALVAVALCGSFSLLKLRQLENTADDLNRLLFSGQSSSQQSISNTKNSKAKLGDGCFHVFLDAGANIGLHTRFLMEPTKYPNAKNAHRAFDMAFGSAEEGGRDPRDICAFGFEPNPAHKQRNQELARAYAAMGWRYYPIEAGLGDVEGANITFYHNDPTNMNSEWGFSVVNRGNDANKLREVVPSIHFAKWIENEIMGRKMPDKIYGNYNNNNNQQPQGKVVLKLDIEGMEFLVAPSLLYTGVMCKTIDIAFGEFHAPGHIPVRAPLDKTTGQGELPEFPTTGAESWKIAATYFNTLWRAMKSMNPKDCKSQWIDMFDEEDYVHDNIPFPTIPNQ